MGAWVSNPEKFTDIRFSSDKSLIIGFNKDGLQVYKVSASPPTLARKYHYDKKKLKPYFGFEESQEFKIDLCEIVTDLLLTKFIVVGGANDPLEPNYVQKVAVFNETNMESEIVVVARGKVISVKCVKNKLIVITEKVIQIFWYDPVTNKCFPYRKETRPNPLGLCEVALDQQLIMVCPGGKDSKEGSLQLMTLNPSSDHPAEFTNYVGEPESIQAHEGELTCIALNEKGSLVATASDKGTLIRVWDTATRNKIHEFRRGRDYVTIKSISFDPNSTLLCCISNKETGHVFSLKNSEQNTRSVFAMASVLFGSYVESQWALAKFQVPVEDARVCALLSEKCILVFCKDGSHRKYEFDEDAGEWPSVECKNIFACV